VQNCEIGFVIPAIAMANPDAQTFPNCGQSVALQVLSYNMHGFYNGLPLLNDLCSDGNISLIAVQEHWLSCDKLHLLNIVHEDYVGFGIGGMKDKLSSGIYRGRPFGGVGFIWRKSLAMVDRYTPCWCHSCLAKTVWRENGQLDSVAISMYCPYMHSAQFHIYFMFFLPLVLWHC